MVRKDTAREMRFNLASTLRMIFSPLFPTRLKYHEQEYVQLRQFLSLYGIGDARTRTC